MGDFDFQREDVNKLVQVPNCLVASEDYDG